MSLWGSSQKALPVPAFTWQPGHWRWATLRGFGFFFFFQSLLTAGEIWALCLSPFSDPASKSPTLVFTVWSHRGRNSRNLLKNLATLHKEKGLVLFFFYVKVAAQSRNYKIWPCLKPQGWEWTKSSHCLGLLGFSFPSLGLRNQEIQISQAVLLCSQVDLSDLESKIEKKKLAIEEAKAQAKGLVPEGVPSLDNTSGFSPIPKNGK